MICRNHNFWHFVVRCSVNCGLKHAVNTPKGPDCINNRALLKEKEEKKEEKRKTPGGEDKNPGLPEYEK